MTYRYAIATLGCKTNQADSADILGRLDPGVFQRVPFEEKADAYVVNSCTVTGAADRQSRQLLYRARRLNADALTIMTGCYANVASETLGQMKDVDFVVTRKDQHQIIEILVQAARKAGYQPLDVDLGPIFVGLDRPFLRIQEGCEEFCAYCIVPMARGPLKSVPEAQVLAMLEMFAKQGAQEVVLTGTHVGKWGKDLAGMPELGCLMRKIGEKRLVPRLRMSSLEPMDIADDVLSAMVEFPEFCPHLHIPIQSAADEILLRMKRPYTVSFLAEKLERIRKAIPHIGIGFDVIAGFPGESEKHFEETLKNLSELPFDYLHVFPFSERPGTEAAAMSGKVKESVKRERARELATLGQERRKKKAEAMLGQSVSVLIEKGKDAEGRWRGFTGDYHPVTLTRGNNMTNRIIKVKVRSLLEDSFRLLAEPMDSDTLAS